MLSKKPFSLRKGFFLFKQLLSIMNGKKIKFTIWADPNDGFLQRVLLIFSRRKIPLSKFSFEASDLSGELHCQLEVELCESLLQRITKQIENILGVKYVVSEVKEKHLSIIDQ